MTRCSLPAVLAYIDREAYLGTLRLATVASYAGMAPTHLSRLLRPATGRTFVQWCRRSRVQRAELLLESSMLSIKEIAALCGYPRLGSLDRDFQRVHGVPPSQWRTEARSA